MYSFRQRIRILTAPKIADVQAAITVSGLGQLILRVTPANFEPYKWLSLTGSGFATIQDAANASKLLADTLLLMGAINRMGVDVGHQLTAAQISQLRHSANNPCPVSNDLGVRIYYGAVLSFDGLDSRGTLTTTPENLAAYIESFFPFTDKLTDRRRNSLIILNDSYFSVQPEAAFLLRVASVEALCDDKVLDPDYVEAVNKVEKAVVALGISGAPLDRMRELIGNARRKSVRQSIRNKFKDVWTEQKGTDFLRLHDLRSAFMHDGKHRGALLEPSNEALELALGLLKADIGYL